MLLTKNMGAEMNCLRGPNITLFSST